MWTTVTTLDTPYSRNGRQYFVSIEGMPRSDGTWAGRIVFRDGSDLRITAQETSQPNRQAVEYWATGLERIYLDGAFERAGQGGGRKQ
jgi:hypothetical protein